MQVLRVVHLHGATIARIRQEFGNDWIKCFALLSRGLYLKSDYFCMKMPLVLIMSP